jgi:hypothetical protein
MQNAMFGSVGAQVGGRPACDNNKMALAAVFSPTKRQKLEKAMSYFTETASERHHESISFCPSTSNAVIITSLT